MAKQTFGNKLVGSIAWLFIGVLVFLGSFYVLYKGVVRTDYASVAEQAVMADESAEDKTFVYATGEIMSDETLGDNLYLKQGEYIAFEREVHMYAWVENVEHEGDEKIYTYDTKWVSDVPLSEDFKERRNHENPMKAEKSVKKVVPEAEIDGYKIDAGDVILPRLYPLELSEENIELLEYQQIVSDDDYDYIYDGYGTYEEPEVGDYRIKYSVLPEGEKVTVFGRLSDSEIEKHHSKSESKLFRLFMGEKEDAIAVLASEYEVSGWMYKISGFLLMWIGLMLMLKPLTVAVEIIPFLSKMGKTAIGIATFAVALLITVIAYLILSIFHSVIGVIVILLIVVGVWAYLNFTKSKIIGNKIKK